VLKVRVGGHGRVQALSFKAGHRPVTSWANAYTVLN